ncbi:Transcriptional regulator, LacI family [[Actinomadura] parvosata subsp. kistnae]|uniref:Transcriptional regulator n=1 Tax=[Actinomadura] parvosata subsp. kistnae TaxID=1909395 RepID=A0A1U9ZVV1_9ACTN|nr:LacI family DNA-binding transcriptional regulator [Nonomuraea sp. ATCC 55076]AQZ62078.1 transcriptional regulator [Nonomuraea sp. ATCC 55076]SPL89424.1 Transcriptional regulator, LacI family [Actinomadura parvosata subsp. kistnae]
MSGTRRRPPGSTDVARLAGVSQKTVSRVMNGEPYVSDEIRERVLAAARELGYRRNTAARALNLGRFHRIGVVSLGSALYGPATQLIELERRARAIGYAFSVVHTLEGDEGGVARAMESLLEQGVDGIVLSDPIDGGQEPRIDPGVPVLSLGPLPGPSGPDVIVHRPSNEDAGREATEHLLGLGHPTVWHVAGPERWWASRDRVRGWRAALAAAGAPEPPLLAGDWTPASGYAAGRALAANPDVTAVFVANDDMAIGVLHALAEAGRAVPGEMSVVGMDDIPAAAYLAPPLTTVRQDFAASAAQGLARLVDRIEGRQDAPAPDVPTTRLVTRRSTRPYRP